jgi:hypothetical protein
MLLGGTCAASICDNKETVIFFGNGIKTSEKNAYDSRNTLKRRLQANLSPEDFELLDFKVSYNKTGGAMRDLFESSIQSLTMDASRFWRILFGHEFMPDWFADYVMLLATALDKSALLATDSLQDHISTYKAKIAEGKKILLVAHSQGVFFGNQAYNNLNYRERPSFAMVAVANPDSAVLEDNLDSAPYTTLTKDKIIQAIIAAKILLPSKPMDPNETNLQDSDDPLQHRFINTYMADGTNSNARVMVDITQALGSLVTPAQVVESGVINVALTWGSAPDVDLHVYEPNGTHVYWYNLDGTSGKLDTDDTSRWGPEHYRVLTCDRIEEGYYEIALDYYKGDNPEVAVVQIDAGLVSRTFTISMGSDLYGTQISPVSVATIFAHKNPDSGYDFFVYH